MNETNCEQKLQILKSFIQIVLEDDTGCFCANKSIINKIAINLSITPQQIELLFNNPIKDIITFYFNRQNQEIAPLFANDQNFINQSSLTQKIKIVLRAKFEQHYINEKFSKSIFKYMLAPQNAILAIKINAMESDFLWKQTLHNPSNISYYTKRISLGLVYASCVAKFLCSNIAKDEMLHFCDNQIDLLVLTMGRIKNIKNKFF